MPAVKNNISFAFGNASKETPPVVKTAYRTVMFLCGVWALVLEPRIPMTDSVTHIVDNTLLGLNSFMYFICQFFGYKQPTNE